MSMYRYETTLGRKGVGNTSELETVLKSLAPKECLLIDRMSEKEEMDYLNDSLAKNPGIHAFLKDQVLHS